MQEVNPGKVMLVHRKKLLKANIISLFFRSPSQITERLDRLIADIRTRFHAPVMSPTTSGTDQKPPCGDVLLVGHGHILRAFAMRWIGHQLTQGVSLLLEGIPSLFFFKRPTMRIKSMGEEREKMRKQMEEDLGL